MTSPYVDANNLTVSFPLSFDKALSARERVAGVMRQIIHRGQNTQPKKRFEALKDVTFNMAAGDIVGLIGPNGCGKTTLLRTVAGIYHPDVGTIVTSGRISTLLSLGTGFNNNLSGRENIAIAGLLMGLNEREIVERTPEIIAYAELGEFIDVPMKFYSSGMISRLGFSMVASMEPDILLVDEVFAVGDLAFRQKSEKTIHNILSRTSCQIIVTHSLDFVRNHCNRAIYLSSGKLIMDGKPDEVVDRYVADVGAEDNDDSPGTTFDTELDMPFS